MFRWPWETKEPIAVPEPERTDELRRAAGKAARVPAPALVPVRPPDLPPGVVPTGADAPVLAMDSSNYGYGAAGYGLTAGFSGFLGYPYLAMLATRAEYRAFASALSTELTREWITIASTEAAGKSTKDKVTNLAQKLAYMGLQQVIQAAAEQDSYYGRGQIYLEIEGQNPELPLVISDKTIKVGAKFRVSNIEPMWTTPVKYNAQDPTAPDFYRPSEWFVLGKKIHASRLLTVVTRPLPDMLKPAFNFSGMSMSQLAEPYVNNWLRTRQSVADLVNNFSTTVLATDMAQVLGGVEGSGDDLFMRAELFTALRSNKGLMLLDKEREELVQVNTPLSGLDSLQAQAQEHMCAVSRIPAMILTGISPSGLNASSEGEIRAFYDWIAAQQEAYWRVPIETVLNVLQMVIYGEIDPDIIFTFDPLFQLTGKELADIRLSDSTAAANYVDRGIISPEEERERLARDPESGYHGLDLSSEPPKAPTEENDNEEE